MVELRRPPGRGQLEDERPARLGGRAGQIIAGARELPARADLMVCPPATLIADFAAAAQRSRGRIGGQDCHAEAGRRLHRRHIGGDAQGRRRSAVIVGHSERRTYHSETDAEVRAKALAGWRAGLMAIVCVGETRAERESRPDARRRAAPARRLAARRRERGQSRRRLRADMGDRHRADPDAADMAEMHGFIRQRSCARSAAAAGIRILYGGSLKASNAQELMKCQRTLTAPGRWGEPKGQTNSSA